MNAIALPETSTPHEGGYYAGRIQIDGRQYALIVAPKAHGEFKAQWSRSYKDVPGAKSFCDGLANTRAMANAGSPIAKKALALTIGEYSDWYITALDELEIIYRAFKPAADKNSQYSRSGINVSAVPPTYPYALELPAQTTVEAFQTGGSEAFEPEGYWSSTAHASNSDSAWNQYFDLGLQDNWLKDGRLRVRVVRRSAI